MIVLPLLSPIHWSTQENEILKCYYESGNPFDIFALKTCSNQDPRAVAHLSQEISRITKYLLESCAEIEAKLTSTHNRRSPITQGGLEIPCKVIVRMPATVTSQKLLDKYKELVKDMYSEPQISELIGSFLYDDIVQPSKENCTKKKKKAAQHYTKSVKSSSMFTEEYEKNRQTHMISVPVPFKKSFVIDKILFITSLISRNKRTMRVIKFSVSLRVSFAGIYFRASGSFFYFAGI